MRTPPVVRHKLVLASDFLSDGPLSVSPGTPLLALAAILSDGSLSIRLLIQTILLDPSGSVWTDDPSNVSRPDPLGADQSDVEHQARDVVLGSPTFSLARRQVRDPAPRRFTG